MIKNELSFSIKFRVTNMLYPIISGDMQGFRKKYIKNNIQESQALQLSIIFDGLWI